jgi:putative antirepressor
MENELKIIDERELLGKQFKIYGDLENPLFLAKDVAEWIDYDISNVSKMVNNVDEDEKLIARINNTSATFLTEDGLYEVLMLSRKPIAKQFKKEIKKILKLIRKTGIYLENDTLNKIMSNPKELGKILCRYGEELDKLKNENENLKNKIQYVYTEDEIIKKDEINYLVRSNCNGNIIGGYSKLYKLFTGMYGIDLREECNKYNKGKEKRLKVNIIQYCLISGYINQLYECCKILYIDHNMRFYLEKVYNRKYK